MPLSIATKFPFNNGVVAPVLADASFASTSQASDIADVNLRRRLVTTVEAASQTPKVTIKASGDQSVNFVGVIGPNVSGAAAVRLLDSSNAAEATGSITLVADKGAYLFLDETHIDITQVEVTFPDIAVNKNLECALIIAGELKDLQVQPNSVRRRFGQLRLERAAPAGSQVPPASRGIYRMMDLIWTELVQPDRDAVRDFLLGVNEHGTVVVRDTARTDDPLYGYINAPLDLTDRRFSDYADGRLSIEEIHRFVLVCCPLVMHGCCFRAVVLEE